MGAIISDAGSKADILSRISQWTTTMTRLNANMGRSEHHTQIQSQTNAHPHHIDPPLCLRDLDANNRSRGGSKPWKRDATAVLCTFHTNTTSQMKQCARKYKQPSVLTKIYSVKKGSYDGRTCDQIKHIVQGTVPGKRKRGRQRKYGKPTT